MRFFFYTDLTVFAVTYARGIHGVPPLNDRNTYPCSPEEKKKQKKKKKKRNGEWRKENPRNVIVFGFVYKIGCCFIYIYIGM